MTGALLGGRRTVDGQRCFEQRSAGSPLLSVQRNFWRPAVLLPDEVGLASCRRQPCVPGCFSGHCDLAKPALRPPMFFRRLASNFSSDWLFSHLLVSAANVSTMLFLDRMVLAVNGFMILNGQRRTVFHSDQRVLVLKRTADLRTNRDLIILIRKSPLIK